MYVRDMYVVLEHFIIEDSWAEMTLQEDSLTVSLNDQAGHSRTLD